MLSKPTSKFKKIVYLACPYTDDDPAVREARFRQATRAAAHLIEKGHIVYSPITMTHPIDLVLTAEGETLGSDYWVAFDEAFMAFCDELVVLKVKGWEKSNGIRREIEHFEAHAKPITYVEPENILYVDGRERSKASARRVLRVGAGREMNVFVGEGATLRVTCHGVLANITDAFITAGSGRLVETPGSPPDQ